MSFIGPNDEILSYVPDSCGRVDASQANLAAADNFQPNKVSYYTNHLDSMIPGFVLGGICAVGFVLMLIWICVRCARHRKRKAAPGESQFLAAGGMASAPPLAEQGAQRRRAANRLAVALLVCAVGAVGVGAWALGESIKMTNSTITDFWSLIHEARTKLEEAVRYMSALSASLAMLAPAAAIIRQGATVLGSKLEAAGVQQDAALSLVGALSDLPVDSMMRSSSAINSTALMVLADKMLMPVSNLAIDFEDPTMTIEETWRWVVFIVLFGLLILLVILATWACFYMRFGRWASLAVALVWLTNAVVMLGGAGILNGVDNISMDACLYMETFIYRQADKISDPLFRDLVVGHLDYYLGVRNLSTVVNDTLSTHVEGFDPELAAAIVEELGGVNVTMVLEQANLINQTVANMTNGGSLQQEVKDLGLDPALEQALLDTLTGLSGMLHSTSMLVDTLRRPAVQPIYHGFKTYICCSLNDSIYWLWLSWIVSGSVTLAYCLLASARVIWQTVDPRAKGWVQAGWGDESSRAGGAGGGGQAGPPAIEFLPALAAGGTAGKGGGAGANKSPLNRHSAKLGGSDGAEQAGQIGAGWAP